MMARGSTRPLFARAPEGAVRRLALGAVHGRQALGRLVERLLPPLVTDMLRARFGAVHFAGDYASWQAAERESRGYAAGDILEQVTRSALAVQQGLAAFERDSVCFAHMERNWPLIACLLWVAAQREGKLHVLDFGGSLGSSYQQCRALLSPISSLRWSVVEQPHFVERGRQLFEDDVLRFHANTQDCLQAGLPDVLYLSSVLPYLRAPYDTLEELLAHGPDFVLIDRTPMMEGALDRLTVQRVAPSIVSASYPAWFFSRAKFLSFFAGRYHLLETFDCADRANVRSRYQGFLFRRVERQGHGR
jgi:putative methyltransferase (TIGR04325 family)